MSAQPSSTVPANGDLETVLVTGGAGFIGSHTVDLLLEEGYRVVVYDNFSTGKRANLPLAHPRLSVVEGDVRDRDGLLAVARDADSCIHLAAQVSVQSSWEDPLRSCQVNIAGFVNLANVIGQTSIDRCVFASSAAVYGDPNDLPLDEKSQTAPLSPYGLEKLTTEFYGDMFAQSTQCRFVAMRYFNVYGPRQDPQSQYSGVISKFRERMSAREPLMIYGDGRQTRDFVYVSDVARANVAALQNKVAGAVNVCTGLQTSLLALASALSAVEGFSPEHYFLDARPGDIRHSCGVNARLRSLLRVSPQWRLLDGLRALAEFDRQVQAA